MNVPNTGKLVGSLLALVKEKKGDRSEVRIEKEDGPPAYCSLYKTQ